MAFSSLPLAPAPCVPHRFGVLPHPATRGWMESHFILAALTTEKAAAFSAFQLLATCQQKGDRPFRSRVTFTSGLGRLPFIGFG